ncbi:hypothetical protein RAJCM14343_1209 [Rhodococcus aetherivorans]|uniref:Uncharacterized protein n=1 Tax=Rhodococcus aetherivorans TaxID=191292 RepID=A0ABQ0YHI4_9NOCA|nr:MULTISPECIES: hypothetical protein [Rhodococcus]ETT27904.1 hypothetical protein RR21198_1544 [Rhodococcus rhodochrous ATCC 21198]MDX5453554.1 hypothetical protein [Rhodococcus sp. (in: high G+C Gram-positive bacteria)]KDE09978.1 hypothetical protein N505_0128415 [Rhodococcus aetherivorans]OLL16136.1 hypothetical protein BKE56_028640 [Rhodococcus sp. M8]QPG48525.1 hypothetical protein ISO16_28365 [Rhodococcus sp. M8]
MREWIAAHIAAAVAGAGSGKPSIIDAASMVELIDSGEAEPVDPDDEFGPVSYDGHVWEWADDTEAYVRT